MRTRADLRVYQDKLSSQTFDNPKLLLAVDMGLGKTVSVLTAVRDLIDCQEVQKVLVVGPKRVAQYTWPEEIQAWDHLSVLTHRVIIGTVPQRLQALAAPADIHIINRENFPWLCAQFPAGKLPYDMIIWDESSSLKEGRKKTGKGALSRFGHLCMVAPNVARIVLLSGTPAPEGIEGLWGQMYVLDGGKRLMPYKTRFLERYFNNRGRKFPDWHIRNGSYETIMGLCSDLMIGLKSEDVLTLPERLDQIIYVDLPPAATKLYKQMKNDFLAEFADTDVVSKNAAVKLGKLAQMASGAVYDDERKVHPVHDEKIEALKELVEQGENLLVFYNYQHDLARLKAAFPDARVLAEDATAMQDWNARKVPMLLAHPASAGHGLNLQHGGRIAVWFSLPWSLEQYEQANKRLHRSGQEMAVIIYHLLARKTVDELLLRTLQAKGQDSGSIVNRICEMCRERDV